MQSGKDRILGNLTTDVSTMVCARVMWLGDMANWTGLGL